MGVAVSKDAACLPCLLLRPRRQPGNNCAGGRLGSAGAEDELFRSILKLQPHGEPWRRAPGACAPCVTGTDKSEELGCESPPVRCAATRA